MLKQGCSIRARVMELAPPVTFMHCMIHRFTLVCKVLPAELSSALSLVVKMANHAKGNTLNSRFFKLLCEDFCASHCLLLFHTYCMCVGFLQNMFL